MEITIFILSSLYLGWLLGSIEGTNIFGTAIHSRAIRYKTAGLIAGVLVVLGAVFQGSGVSGTLSGLGMVNAPGGAFVICLCTALVVTTLAYYKISAPVSQAIVGAILGWCFYTSSQVDLSILGAITASWVASPLLGALVGALLFLLMRYTLQKRQVHLIKLDRILQYGLFIAGGLCAFSFGANNIAAIMGVFVNSVQWEVNLGPFALSSVHILFLLGGVSVASGISRNFKRTTTGASNNLLAYDPATALVVVLSQATVLFLFSSTFFSPWVTKLGLPAIPPVPVSATQVAIGALMGIGAVRGVREVRFKTVGVFATGWLLTPLFAGIATYVSLFFFNNVFNIQVAAVQHTTGTEGPLAHTAIINISDAYYKLIAIVFILAFIILFFALFLNYKKAKMRMKQEGNKWLEQMQYADFQKELADIEIKNVEFENQLLAVKLETEKSELITYALSIGEQREFLESVNNVINEALNEPNEKKKDQKLNDLSKSISLKMSFTDEIEEFYIKAKKLHHDFPGKLARMHPNLTEQEKKLMILLRIGFSSKEIAPILNISPKSVEIGRYRLRKKLNLQKEDNLTQYIKTIN